MPIPRQHIAPRPVSRATRATIFTSPQDLRASARPARLGTGPVSSRVRENYTYAGRGLVHGQDGRVYMHLFVR